MKRVIFFKSCLFAIIIVMFASVANVSAQVSIREQRKLATKFYNKEFRGVSKLKGSTGQITDLNDKYCSEDAFVEIRPELPLNGLTDVVEWKIREFSNGTSTGTEHPGWGDVVNAGTENAYLRFYPNRIGDAFHDDVDIYISYEEKTSSNFVLNGKFDYTRIYKSPTEFNFGSNVAICSGNTADLTLSGSQEGINYYLLLDGAELGGAGFTLPGNGGQLTYTVSSPGNYTVIAKNVNHDVCSKPMNGSATVTVNNLPSASATNDGNACLGSSFTLRGGPDGMSAYEWTNASGAVVGNTQDLTLNSVDYGTGAHSFTLSIEDNNTCKNTAATSVTVYVNPSVELSYNAPVCDGGRLVISSSASGGSGSYTTYIWTKDGVSIGGNTPNLEIDPASDADNGVYGVTVIDSNGCASSEETVTVSIQALPSPTINSDAAETTSVWCEGETIQIVGGGGAVGATYSWLLPDGTTQTGATLTIPSADELTYEGEYTLTLTEGTCVNTLKHNVTIHSNPLAVAGNGGNVCLGDDFVLNGDPNGMSAYQWTNAGGTVVGNTQDLTLNSGDYGTGSHTFTLLIEDNNTCTSTATTAVTINGNPSVTPSYNAPVCDGAQLLISSNPTGGSGSFTTYVWRKDGVLTGGNTQNLDIDPASVADNGAYGVTVTDTNGCSSSEQTVTVAIQVLPVPTINSSATETTSQWCDGETVQIVGGGGAVGATYSWLLPDGSTQTGATLTITNADKATYEGDYTLTLTEGTCVNTLKHIVIIHTNPIAVAGNGGNVCLGSNFVLNGDPDGMNNYQWTNAGGSNVGNAQDLTLNSGDYGTGTHTFTLLIEDNNTCTSTSTTAVTINGNPNVAPSYNSPVCIGSELIISANATGGSGTFNNYTWTYDGNPLTETSETISIPNANTVHNGAYGVIVTDSNGCSSSEQTVAVSMQALPSPTINSDAAETTSEWCDGETIVIFGGGGAVGATYSWLLPDASTQTGATLTITNADKSTYEGDYTLTITEGTCVNSLKHTVTIHSNPTAVAGNGGDVCLGNNLILNGDPDGMTSYQWTNAGGTVIGTTQDLTLNSVDYGSGTHTFTLSIEDNNTCKSTATTSIIVNDVEASISVTAPASGVTTICAGTAVTFNANGVNGSGNYSYEFHRVRGVNDVVVQNGASPTYVATGAEAPTNGDEYYVIVNDITNSCTDQSSSIQITVIDNPVPTVTITNNGGSNIICSGEQLDFEATPDVYARYVFSINGTAEQDGVGNTFSYSTFATGDIVTVTAYTSLDASACFGTSSNLSVTVNDRPTPDFTGNLTVCNGAEETYTANTTIDLGKGNYSWVLTGGTLATGSALDEESVSVVWDLTGPHSVSLNYVNSNNCEAESPIVKNITVNTVTAGLSADNTTICSGENVTFTATGGVTYEFLIDDVVQTVADPTSNEFVASGLTNGQVVKVTAFDAIGCENTHGGITISVNTTPTPTITSGPSDICNGESATYSTEGGFLNYNWTVSGGTINGSSDQNSVDVTWNTDGTQSIKVSYTSVAGNCVGPEAELAVTVNAVPSGTTVTTSPGNNVIQGTDITFTATGGNEYAFYKVDAGGDIELQGKSTTDFLIVSTEAPSTNPVLVHGDVVRVYIYNAAGCSVYHEITVGVFEGITPFDVIASAAGHCYGESIEFIQLSGFQSGITYELFRVSTPDDISLGKILASAGVTSVKWEADITGSATPVEYRVEAYYDGTPPTPGVPMNNTVLVEEYADLQLFNMSPTTAIDGAGTCGTAQTIKLDGSETDVNYQLIVNGTSIVATEPGTGVGLDFGSPNLVGIYTINAVKVNAGVTTCEKIMTGEWEVTGADITEYNLVTGDDPAAVPSSFDGRYCENNTVGVHIWLQNSQSGYSYELWREGIQAGTLVSTITSTGGAIDFEHHLIDGSYEVAVNDGGCYYPMSNSIQVEKITLPLIYNMTVESNGVYCQADADGVQITLDNQQEGIEYRVFRDGSGLNNSEGAAPVSYPVTGNGSGAALPLGAFLTQGNYYVGAQVNGLTGCSVISNNVDIKVLNNPSAIVLEGSDTFCEGDNTTLHIVNPEDDVTYALYKDGVDSGIAGAPIGVPVSRIEWDVNAAGLYTVVANTNNPIVCGPTVSSPIDLQMTTLPIDKVVDVIAPADPTSCAGTIIKVLAPEATMSYSVVSNITNFVVPGYTKIGADEDGDGTIDDIEFDPITDNGGLYRVEATNVNCTIVLTLSTGSVPDVTNISISSPNAVAKKDVEKPGAICQGEGGVLIGVHNPDPGISYVLYKAVNDVDRPNNIVDDIEIEYFEAVAVPPAIQYFNEVFEEGEYHIVGRANYADQTSDCNNSMLETINVEYNPLPIAYRLVGSGLMCDDGTTITNATIGLEGSQIEHKYRLIYEDPVSGDRQVAEKDGEGGPISFEVDQIGKYSIYAISVPFGCTSLMEGEINVVKADAVTHQDLKSGDFTYCNNDPLGGYMLSLLDQEFNVIYTVVDDSGNIVHQLTGGRSGSPLDLGVVPSGTYSILGAYSVDGACQIVMHDNIVVKTEPETPMLAEYNSMFCHSDEGATLGLLFTEVGIDYYVVNKSSNTRLSWLTGTGSPAEFPDKVTEGTYYVIAKSFATGCESQSNDVTILRYSELELFNIKVGDIVVNEGEIGVGSVNVDEIKLNNSTVGVTYTLRNGIVPIDPSKPGDGDELNYGVQSEGGIYTIIAEAHNCMREMNGKVRLEVKNLIANDTLIAVPKGEDENTLIVHQNDELEHTVLDLLGKNIKFSLIDPTVNPYPDPTATDFKAITSLETVIGNKATIDPITGALLLVKKPSYYGRDSVQYLIYNTEHTHRYDIATVKYFMGNADFDKSNNLLIPNAFSPNGDDINDKFEIDGSYGEGEKSVAESNLEVFNRWGTIVYRSKGSKYDNSWDGRSNAGAMVSIGDKLPSGTYFYIYTITINDKESNIQTKKFTGYIELRR